MSEEYEVLQRGFFERYPLTRDDIDAVARHFGTHYMTVRNWVVGHARIQRDAFDWIVAEILPRRHPDADPELIAGVRAVANPHRLRRMRSAPAPTPAPAAAADRLPFDHDGDAMPYTVLVAFLRTARLTPEQRFGLIRVLATGGAS